MVDRNNRKAMGRDMYRSPMGGMSSSCHKNPPMMRQEQNGCGCQGGELKADCKAMARRLQTVEFSMYDVMLYLDIYPECSEALAYYGKLCEERDALRASLAKRCHRPVSACETDVEQGWSWIASPWPWDTAAN